MATLGGIRARCDADDGQACPAAGGDASGCAGERDRVLGADADLLAGCEEHVGGGARR